MALRNRRDRHHPVATALVSEHSGAPLVTSSQVRGETWTYLRRKAGHASAVAFLDALDASPRIGVLAIEAKHEKRAIEWLRRHDERPYSFVDATSFALMRSLKISRAFAFDGDFTAAGFQELRPSA